MENAELALPKVSYKAWDIQDVRFGEQYIGRTAQQTSNTERECDLRIALAEPSSRVLEWSWLISSSEKELIFFVAMLGTMGVSNINFGIVNVVFSSRHEETMMNPNV